MNKSIRHIFLVSALIVILAASFLAVSCAPSQSGPIVIRYSCGLSSTETLVTEYMPLFASEIEKRTNGRVVVENYGGAELYKHDEVVDAVTTGAIEMGLNSISHWAGRSKLFASVNYFFLIRNQEQYLAAADEVMEILDKEIQSQNAKLQGYVYFSSVAIASVVPIKSPADVAGLKIRAPNEGMLELSLIHI